MAGINLEQQNYENYENYASTDVVSIHYDPENATNQETKVTIGDSSLADVKQTEEGNLTIQVSQKGNIGATTLEAENILSYENENLLARDTPYYNELTEISDQWEENHINVWGQSAFDIPLDYLGLEIGETLTASVELDDTDDTQGGEKESGLYLKLWYKDSEGNILQSNNSPDQTRKYERFYATATGTIPEGTVKIQLYFYRGTREDRRNFWYRKLKLERGSESTPWSPAQVDRKDDSLIKKAQIPVGVQSTNYLDYQGKVRNSDQENPHKMLIDIRDFEDRNLLKGTSDKWEEITFYEGHSGTPIKYFPLEDLELKPGDSVTLSEEVDNTIDDFNTEVSIFLAVPAEDRKSYTAKAYSKQVELGESKTLSSTITIPEKATEIAIRKTRNDRSSDKVANSRCQKLQRGSLATSWTPAPEDKGIPYGQPNLVNGSSYSSKTIDKDTNALISNSDLSFTEAQEGDPVSTRIEGAYRGYYDSRILLQGYKKDGTKTGDIGEPLVINPTNQEETWTIEAGEIPKDTEEIRMYSFLEDDDFSMTRRNLLEESKSPRTAAGEGKTNQILDSYSYTVGSLEGYVEAGDKMGFQSDISVEGYDFAPNGKVSFETATNEYLGLGEVQVEAPENLVRNSDLDSSDQDWWTWDTGSYNPPQDTLEDTPIYEDKVITSNGTKEGQDSSLGFWMTDPIEIPEDVNHVLGVVDGYSDYLRNHRNYLLQSRKRVVEPKDIGYNYETYKLAEPIPAGEKVTLSGNIEVTDGSIEALQFKLRHEDGSQIESYYADLDLESGTFKKVLVAPEDVYFLYLYVGTYDNTMGNGAIFTNVKIEAGDTATDWSPAPEDISNVGKIRALFLDSDGQNVGYKEETDHRNKTQWDVPQEATQVVFSSFYGVEPHFYLTDDEDLQGYFRTQVDTQEDGTPVYGFEIRKGSDPNGEITKYGVAQDNIPVEGNNPYFFDFYAKAQPSQVSLNDPNRNYFVYKYWRNKPYKELGGVPIVELELEPNEVYTLATDVPQQEISSYYDVFFGNVGDKLGSSDNGVGAGEPRTLTTNEDGMVYVGIRNYAVLPEHGAEGYVWITKGGTPAEEWKLAPEDQTQTAILQVGETSPYHAQRQEIGTDWERVTLTKELNDSNMYVGIEGKDYGSIQVMGMSAHLARKDYHISEVVTVDQGVVDVTETVRVRLDDIPSTVKVTTQNVKFEKGNKVTPYTVAPEEVDNPKQYSQLANTQIQVVKGPLEAQDNYKKSYYDYYSKNGAIYGVAAVPSTLPDAEPYSLVKQAQKPSSLLATYETVPKFDPQVEITQDMYDSINTAGKTIKARTNRWGDNAEIELNFETIKAIMEEFPEYFEGLSTIQEQIDKYYEIAKSQKVVVRARAENGTEEENHNKVTLFKHTIWSGWETYSGSSGNSNSSSISEIDSAWNKGSFWGDRWVIPSTGISKVLVASEPTEQVSEKEVEVQSARLEVVIQPPEDPNAKPKTIIVKPIEKGSEE